MAAAHSDAYDYTEKAFVDAHKPGIGLLGWTVGVGRSKTSREESARGIADMYNKIIIGTSVLFVSCIVVLTLLQYSTYYTRA